METQFRTLFDIFHIVKSNKVVLLQSLTGCYYNVRHVLQSVTIIIIIIIIINII